MKIIKSILACLLILIVGSVAAASLSLIQNPKNSSSSSEPKPIKLFYTSLDFSNLTINTNALSKEVLLQILNNQREIFESVSEIQNVYRDEGSLKFGNASSAGNFKVTLKEGYEISHVAITGRAYSRLSTSNETWSCDKSAVTIYMQDSTPDFYPWANNDGNTTKRPDEMTMTFTTLRSNYFQIIGAAATTTNKTYRFDLYKIEFWLGQVTTQEV